MENVNTVGNLYRAFGLSISAGFVSFAAQIIYLREILSLLPENEVIISLYFTVYLISVGLGAYFFRKINYKRLFLYFPPLFLFSLLVFRPSMRLSVYVPGQLPPLRVFIIALALVVPFSLVSGGFFSALVREFKNPWLVYGGDAIGSFLSGLLLYLLLLPRFPSYISAFFIMTIFGMLVFVYRLRLQALFSLILFVPLILIENVTWEKVFHPLKIEYVKESPYGKITLSSYHGIYTIWENGEKLYDYPPSPAEKLAYLSLLQIRDTSKGVRKHYKVLLIGGGGRCLKYLKRVNGIGVTYVEPNPVLAEIAARIFKISPSVIVMDDGRKFVNETNRRFDFVIIDLPPPTTSSSSRFYTVEFFSRLSKIARRVSLSFPGGNYYSDVDSRILSSVYFSLKETFPFVKVIPGEELVLIGSNEDFEISPQSYQSFLSANSITPEFYFPVQLSFETNPIEMDKLRQALVRGTLNRDDRPVTYIYSLVKWLRHYFPGFPLFKTSPLWVVVLIVVGVLPFVFRSPSLFMGTISFSAFATELLLFLLFQYKYGYIYLQISLLAGIIMLSLGLGSILFRKRISPFFLLLIPLMLVFFPSSVVMFYVLFFVLGFFEGGSFAFISEKTEASKLYLFDLLGSALAGLILGIILIPLLGFKGCFIAILILFFTSAIGVMKL